jgi:hypothetical protein
MARPGEFVDPDYDRRLAEFKAKRDRMRKETGSEKNSVKGFVKKDDKIRTY